MKIVTLTRGLPASGKTTWAKNMLSKHPGAYKRVNKDDLRALLDDSKWSKDNEKFVLKIRDAIILEALKDGKHVIVDDTNLHPKHWAHIKELVKGLATVSVMDFGLSPEECIERDLKRENSVGAEVIWDMYNQFVRPPAEAYEHDPALPSAYIFDIDGTLAHMKDRGPFDWYRVGEDEPDEALVGLLRILEGLGENILLVSGRDAVCMEETRRWLKKHDIPFKLLVMRPEGDNRKDSIVKREIFDGSIRGKYNVKAVFDDRDQVVKMWREMGLKCYQVADGNF